MYFFVELVWVGLGEFHETYTCSSNSVYSGRIESVCGASKTNTCSVYYSAQCPLTHFSNYHMFQTSTFEYFYLLYLINKIIFGNCLAHSYVVYLLFCKSLCFVLLICFKRVYFTQYINRIVSYRNVFEFEYRIVYIRWRI